MSGSDAIATKGPLVLALMRGASLVILAVVVVWIGSLIRKDRNRWRR